MDLDRYGTDLDTLAAMYAEWESGVRSKSAIERRYLGKSTHHGKLFSRLMRDSLGIETIRPSTTTAEIKRLRSLLEHYGIDPETGVMAPRLPTLSEEND